MTGQINIHIVLKGLNCLIKYSFFTNENKAPT